MVLPIPTNLERLRPPWRHKASNPNRPVPELIALPREEAERVRSRLDQLERTCACGFGVAGAFLALSLYIAPVAFWFDPTANNVWPFGAVGFVVLLIGAGLGKAFGLRRARSQRDRLLDELYSRTATPDGSALRALNASPESAFFRAPDRAHGYAKPSVDRAPTTPGAEHHE